MEDELLLLRKQISYIDKRILKLFEKRFKLVEEVGEYKKKNNIPVRNVDREGDLIETAVSERKLDPIFIKKLYELIFDNSYKLEK